MSYACLVLPFPGSVNGLWRCVKGRNILSARGRDYQTEAARALLQQHPLPHFNQPVEIIATLGRPDRRKRDLDNHWKACGDALVKAGVLLDDSLIHKLTLQWGVNVIGVQVEIEDEHESVGLSAAVGAARKVS